MPPQLDTAAEASPIAADEQFNRARRPTGLVEQVYEQTCDAILLGRFTPGGRLNIRQLAEAMHVSATPVREALSRLISEGILEASDTRAIVVPQVSVDRLNEIFDLRVLLEGELAEAAATCIPEPLLVQICGLQEELVAALDEGNYKEVLRCNARFHFAIYEAANKPLALQIVRGLWLRIGPTLHLNYPVLAKTRQGTTRHNRIIEAIRARDPDALRAGIIDDVRGSQSTICAVMLDTPPAGSRARKVAAAQ